MLTRDSYPMHRLPAPLSPHAIRGERVRLTVEGRIVAGYTHESVAAAILASGRTALSRSLRFHRPRAMFCSTGECGWCAMEVDGLPNVHTCAVPCRPDLSVRSQNAWPSAEWDVFAPLDLLSRRLPYTFYHHRLLRPRALRQHYLRGLRFFTGLGRLATSATASQGKEIVSAETDVAVIGGGPAGLSAALAAAEQGARVVLIDDQDAPGGHLRRSGQNGLQHLLDLLDRFPGLTYWRRARCVGIYAPQTLGVVMPQALASVKARQIILAPGALDALPLFANNDLPGVISARLAERLLALEGVAPGSRAVVWGPANSTNRLTRLMDAAGIELTRTLGAGEAVVEARGRRRVRAAVVRDGHGATHAVPCDLIVIGMLQPRAELLAQAGGGVAWAPGGPAPLRNAWLESTVAGVYVVGEAADVAEADRCVAEGRLAGAVAAFRSTGTWDTSRGWTRKPPQEIDALAAQVAVQANGSNYAWQDQPTGGAAHVCFCEDVREWEIRAEMERGYAGPELVKRRTGVLTGPCQGKYCLANAMRVMGDTTIAPTARPPARPVRLGDLLAK